VGAAIRSLHRDRDANAGIRHRGDLPDLIMASNEHTPTLSTSGILMDLNPFIEKDGDVNTDDFAAGVSQGFNMWGRWWGFPYDVTTFRDLLQQGHVRRGRRGLPACHRRTVELGPVRRSGEGAHQTGWRTVGVWMSGDFAWDQYRNSNFIYSAGGRNFDDQLRHCIIASPESANGIQFLVDLIHTTRSPPHPRGPPGDVDYFASVLAAMKVDVIRPRQTSQTPISRSLSGLPVGREARGDGGSGFTMSASTKQAMRRGGG